MSKGILVVVSGFSGSGKGTVMKRLMEKYDNYALSVSVTTRSPRPGEKDGEAYFFRTKEEFEQMIQEDGLIEYAQYVENYYGTPRKYVEEQLASGKDVILEIEIQGAMKIREKFPDTLLVFVCPPSMEELKNRLVGRGTETEDGGTGAKRDLQKIRKKLLQQGVFFQAAAIGSDKEAIQEIYEESFLDITDLEQLPALLTKKLLRFIRR